MCFLYVNVLGKAGRGRDELETNGPGPPAFTKGSHRTVEEDEGNMVIAVLDYFDLSVALFIQIGVLLHFIAYRYRNRDS